MGRICCWTMLATLLSAALTCAAALLIGQGCLRLCGVRAWTWLAAPVGLSAVMAIAVCSLHLPGRAISVGVVLTLCAAASLTMMVREPDLRPPLSGIAAALPTLGLTLLPFAATGRFGTLGVGFNNDMAAHLAIAEAVSSESISRVNGVTSTYPLGPHSLTAAIGAPLSLPLDLVFAGVTMAGPLLLGWTALAALHRVGWIGQMLVASLVGMPYLIAGFYGEGAFKEVYMAVLIVGAAIALARHPLTSSVLRWVPYGLIAVGTLSVYSYSGLLWPAVFVGGWLTALLAIELRRREGARTRVLSVLRREAPVVVVGLLVLVAVLIPQIRRILRYLSDTGGGTGLDPGSLGNLAGRLPFWEALNVWNSRDFRFAPTNVLDTGAWAGLVLALVLVGIAWWLRRRQWELPLAAALTFVVWVLTDRTQAPYAAAKALVLLSPFIALLVVRPLVERDGWPLLPSRWSLAAPVVGVVLVFAALGSSWKALRYSPVGPREHMLELRDLRSSLRGRPTLWLGNDDFIRWELAGVPVSAPLVGIPVLGWRAEKNWQYGQALDIDAVDSRAINAVDWVIAPRDPAASAMPSQLRLVRETKSFALYRRVGRVPQRRILAEGPDPAKVLDCKGDTQARRLVRRRGIAVVRAAPVGVLGPTLAAGGDRVVSVHLAAGTWDIVMQYTSGLDLTVFLPGLSPVEMPANLDRPGPRYLVGRVAVDQPGAIGVRIKVDGHPLSSTVTPAAVSAINAVPVAPVRQMPLRAACGKLVDYYRLASG